jgi:hypothetical protein
VQHPLVAVVERRDDLLAGSNYVGALDDEEHIGNTRIESILGGTSAESCSTGEA